MEFGIFSLYSNLIDTKIKFCSLCFKFVQEDAVCVQDSVILGLDEDDAECSNSEEVDLQYILQEILGERTASLLSENDAICDKCTRSAISSYKFIKMCKTNTESMANAVDIFTTTIGDGSGDFGDHKTMFLSMNFHDSSCIQYFDTMEFENNNSALTRFQSLFRPYRLLTDKDGNTKYKCTKCPTSYLKATSAHRHFTSKHIEFLDIKEGGEDVNTVSAGDSPTKVGKCYTKHDIKKTHTVIKGSDGKCKYKCRKCPTVCTKAVSARRHYQLVHAQIEKSTSRSKTREMVRDHIRHLNEISFVEVSDSDGAAKYQCTECVTISSTAADARQHFETTHMEEDTSDEILAELNTEPKLCTCIFCNEIFDDKYVLTIHILKEHSMETLKDVSAIKADNQVFKHVYTTVKDENGCKKCQCRVCGKLYKSHTIVTTHFKKQHWRVRETDEQFICRHCGKECNDQFALKKHEEVHTLKLTCQTCNKVYKNRACFKQHVCFKQRVRSEMKREVICHHCGKYFVSKHSVRLHIRYYHDSDGQRFKCQYCPRTFGAISLLKGHLVKHTRERNFSCELCGNVFVTKMALLYHTRIHTGERPFECKYCDMKFLSSSRRSAHVKSHHIVELATCPICGVTIKSTGMAKHKRRHNNANSTLYVNKDGESVKKRQGSKISVKKAKQMKYNESDDDSDTEYPKYC